MAFTDQLLQAARPIWDAQVRHPFVRGIADGSLDADRFRRWIVQDYLYLVEFARLFAWAAAKADRLESMSWYAGALDLTLHTEMSLHRRFAGRFGVSTEELATAPMCPTTRAYTDFLVRTAAEGDLADLVAGLLPCVWGYVYLARRLADSGRPADPRYAEWIDQYSSEEFAEAAAWLRTELDRLVVGLDERRLARLRDLFLLSSRYELRFWEMCWRGESWPEESAQGS